MNYLESIVLAWSLSKLYSIVLNSIQDGHQNKKNLILDNVFDWSELSRSNFNCKNIVIMSYLTYTFLYFFCGSEIQVANNTWHCLSLVLSLVLWIKSWKMLLSNTQAKGTYSGDSYFIVVSRDDILWWIRI